MNTFSDSLSISKSMFKLILIIFFSFCILFPFMYFASYKLINIVDPSIYARYATNEKFDENIFFNSEVDVETGILNDLYLFIDFSHISRIQDFANLVIVHKSEVRDILSQNESYQEYLTKIGSSVDDVIEWFEKIASLDYKISLACLYLVFLLISFIIVVLLGFRTSFYVCSGIVYIIAMLSMFSDGISDYLVINGLSVLAKFSKQSSELFTYANKELLTDLFAQAFKESALTFIIFDTVVQIFQSNKKEHFRYLYCSLEFQCSYLCQFKNNSHQYAAKMSCPVDEAIKFCNKNIRKNNGILKKIFSSRDMKEDMQLKCEQYRQLRDLIILYCRNKNREKFTTKEYISYWRQIQWLMCKCKLV